MIFELSDVAADIVFGAWPGEYSKDNREIILRRKEDLFEWLRTLIANLPHALSHQVNEKCEAIRERYRGLERGWLDVRDAEQQRAWTQDVQAKCNERAELSMKTIRQGLRLLGLGELGETLLDIFQRINETYAREWDNASSEERGRIQEEMADLLSLRLKDFSKQLPLKELDAANRKVEETMGPLWPALSPEEQKSLSLGFHLMDYEHLHSFSALSLGLAVENCLSSRVFTRIRDALKDIVVTRPLTVEEDDYIENQLLPYFNGKKGHLMLGQMVGAFNRAMKNEKSSSRPCGSVLADYLATLPAAGIFLHCGKSLRKARSAALEKITELRNGSAHAIHPPTEDSLRWLWDHVAVHPDLAFFRYFVETVQ
jgi:hypothetical protein